MEDKDELLFRAPDPKTIPCLKCKWGRLDYMAIHCMKYSLKPKDVYYENADCDNFEKL